MRIRARIVVAACLAGAALLLIPADVNAQGLPRAESRGRRAVVRTVRPARVVVARAYYRPFFYDPWYFSPYGHWYPPYYYGYAQGYESSVRLQVEPREAEVFIDGYYAGTVDDFDGVFQRLHIEPGEHEIELFLPGHRSLTRKIYLQPGGTFRVRHTMEPLGPGETEPVKPAPRTPAVQRVPSQGAPPANAPPRPGPRRPRDPRERASNAESTVGSLAVRVQPGEALILIDGERWEGGPDDERLIIQLGAGTHQVEIQKEGYRTHVTHVTIRRGETETLNVSLSKE